MTYNNERCPRIQEQDRKYDKDGGKNSYERQHQIKPKVHVLLPECEYHALRIVRQTLRREHVAYISDFLHAT